jgi:hypothetical protein
MLEKLELTPFDFEPYGGSSAYCFDILYNYSIAGARLKLFGKIILEKQDETNKEI